MNWNKESRQRDYRRNGVGNHSHKFLNAKKVWRGESADRNDKKYLGYSLREELKSWDGSAEEEFGGEEILAAMLQDEAAIEEFDHLPTVWEIFHWEASDQRKWQDASDGFFSRSLSKRLAWEEYQWDIRLLERRAIVLAIEENPDVDFYQTRF